MESSLERLSRVFRAEKVIKILVKEKLFDRDFYDALRISRENAYGAIELNMTNGHDREQIQNAIIYYSIKYGDNLGALELLGKMSFKK